MESLQEVSVLLDHEGNPSAFLFSGRHYLVFGRPIRWYARKAWWQEASAAPSGSGQQLVETEIWRLRASCENDGGIFELRRDNEAWQAQRIE